MSEYEGEQSFDADAATGHSATIVGATPPCEHYSGRYSLIAEVQGVLLEFGRKSVVHSGTSEKAGSRSEEEARHFWCVLSGGRARKRSRVRSPESRDDERTEARSPLPDWERGTAELGSARSRGTFTSVPVLPLS